MNQSADFGNGNSVRMDYVPEIPVVETQEHFPELGNQISGKDFQSEHERIEVRLMDIRSSWRTTGCSVLLDGWRDGKERHLINVLVDCPKGPIYLRSLDISVAMGDSDALVVVFSEIIEEVGADNVVQIITNYTLPCMKEVGKLLMEKYPTIFWTVSSSHCLELMLEKMASADFERILNEARCLTRFIYSRPEVLNLMRSFTSSTDLLKFTKIRSIMPFLTLDNIVCERKNLKKMFSSSLWRSSVWASCSDGKKVVDLVGDASFWSGAIVVLKATIPLVSALRLIHESAEPQMGFIYETIDQAKEAIKNYFDKEEALYASYWKVIDEVWDNCLHSPLHSAGYFLNPQYRFATDFYADSEVYGDLFYCICYMVEDKKVERLVTTQARLYIRGKDSFSQEEAIKQSSVLSPVEWWLSYGKECPELQNFAIRILNQTCDGASKYHLDRGWAEKLFTEERDEIDQQQLRDLTFDHYNAQLEEFVQQPINHYCEIDPMDEWIVDETLETTPLNAKPSSMKRLGSAGATTSRTKKASRST